MLHLLELEEEHHDGRDQAVVALTVRVVERFRLEDLDGVLDFLVQISEALVGLGIIIQALLLQLVHFLKQLIDFFEEIALIIQYVIVHNAILQNLGYFALLLDPFLQYLIIYREQTQALFVFLLENVVLVRIFLLGLI